MLTEKAKSRAQQRYMAMVAHGTIERPKGLSKDKAREFAKTKHKGLPDRVKETDMSLIDYLITEKKAKPDFLDADKDGDKKEPMKKAQKDKKKKVKEENMGDYFSNPADEFDQRPQVNDCPDCEGSGQDHMTGRKCDTCDGEGQIYETIHHKNSAPHLNRDKREDTFGGKHTNDPKLGQSHVKKKVSNRAAVGNYLRRTNQNESFTFVDFLINEDKK